MEQKPLVSAVMPVFNTEKYVTEAIESVFSQTYPDIELICVDDGSSDGTLEILHSYGDRIQVLTNETNLGIAKSRNKAIAAARGEFIALIDADDIWHPEKIEKQMQQFEKDADLAMSFTFLQCFLSPELPEEIKNVRYCPPDPSPGYISGTAVIKRSVLDTVGPFDGQWHVGEFIDWYTKAQDQGFRSAIVNEVLYRRRIHATNTGVNERDSRTDYLKIARQVLERRRQNNGE